MKLSIIIVAYNNGNELIDCLNSIFDHNDLGEDLEVIVVDNSPNDKVECNIVGYKGVTYIKNPENGFGRGNNIGYHNSSGDYLLFLNPDTLIISPCFQKLISLYSTDKRIGMAGVRLLDAKGKENNSYNIRLKYGLFKKFLLKTSRRFGFFISRLMYTCGADIFIDRETFAQIGCFDENIFMYGEEEDIAYRLDKIDKKIAYFQQISIVHLQGKSSGHRELVNRKRMAISSEYICNKYGFNFKKQIRKEIRAMNIINMINSARKKEPKYSSEVLDYYKSLV